jgi:hypothetical protein
MVLMCLSLQIRWLQNKYKMENIVSVLTWQGCLGGRKENMQAHLMAWTACMLREIF